LQRKPDVKTMQEYGDEIEKIYSGAIQKQDKPALK